jgi:uncharacterized protein DUF1566
MTTRRRGFIGLVAVASLLVCWAGTALAAGPKAAAAQAFPATGQTSCWNSAGVIIPCFGTGQDGDIQAGATLSYTDNGDGTITDDNTNLVWEKKSDDGSIHDKDNLYTWDAAFEVHVAGLNAANFAGRNDWRLPNVKELQSIVDYENFPPAVAPAFNNNCNPGTTTVFNGSCTAASLYWSSSTFANFPDDAWVVFFSFGNVDGGFKNFAFHVRAVRGGSNLGSSK